MLYKIKEKELNKYIDFGYNLSQSLTTTSFPIYLDGIKTKDDFSRKAYLSFEENNSEILLFKKGDDPCGYIHYYCLDEEKYIGLKVFNVSKNFPCALDEFIKYISDKHKGYNIYFQFPKENHMAINALDLVAKKEDYKHVFVLNFDDYNYLKEDEEIRIINKYNFNDFRKLHDKYDDIYYNSDRLYKELLDEDNNRWKIYGLYRNGEIASCIYFVYFREMVEIFGIDYKDECFNEDQTKKLLIKAFNKSKLDNQKHLTFFADENLVNILKELKLKYICDYLLYIMRLE